MRLLFEDLARRHFTPERVQKLKGWVENADIARTGGQLERGANQYDKAEELITFYTFAPLELRTDKKDVVQEILRFASIKEPVYGNLAVCFEKLVGPPKGYLIWLANNVSKHYVKYMREQAVDHNKRNKPLETHTHVDALIETGNLIIFVEMKFTSDISSQTTFNVHRNQLARLIDIGISEAQTKGKKLILLVSSPSEYFTKKSRLYFYKVKEYSDYKEICKDIDWRKQQEIEKHLLSVAWVPIEKLVEITYSNFSHPDKGEAIAFFRERKLF